MDEIVANVRQKKYNFANGSVPPCDFSANTSRGSTNSDEKPSDASSPTKVRIHL